MYSVSRTANIQSLGTSFRAKHHKTGNEELEMWLLNRLNPRIDIECFEFEYEDKYISVYGIPASTERHVTFLNAAYIRVGSLIKPPIGYPEKEAKLLKKNGYNSLDKIVIEECASNYSAKAKDAMSILVKESVIGWLAPVAGFRTDMGFNTTVIQCSTEFLAIESGIVIIEKSVNGYFYIVHKCNHFLDVFLYLVQICMVLRLWLRHGEGYSLIIREEKRTGCATFLTALIFNLLFGTLSLCVRSIYVGVHEVESRSVFFQEPGMYLLPFPGLVPFPVMMEHRL